VLGLLGACQQPPTREIAAAEAQMEQARQAGADRYAPNQWREAQQALEQARTRIQTKDYRGALSSANEAADKARAAARASLPAKGVVRSSTEMTQAEIRSVLEEVTVAHLISGKLPKHVVKLTEAPAAWVSQ